MSRIAVAFFMLWLVAGCSPAESPQQEPTDAPEAPPVYSCFPRGAGGQHAAVDVRNFATGKTQAHGSLVVVPDGPSAGSSHSDFRFSVHNCAEKTALDVQAIRIVQPANPGSPPPFSCWDLDRKTPCEALDGSWPEVVYWGSEDDTTVTAVQFVVRFEHQDEGKHSAELELKLSGDPAFESKAYVIRFTSLAGPAKIKLQPDELHFGPLKPGKAEQKSFGIYNVGEEDLLVHGIHFAANPVFMLSIADQGGNALQLKSGTGTPLAFEPPLTIASHEKKTATVEFVPISHAGKEGIISVSSSDPNPDGGRLLVYANSTMPCIAVVPPDKVHFGGIQLGTTATRDVVIQNCGGLDLVVHQVDLGKQSGSNLFALDFQQTVAGYPAMHIGGPSKSKPLVIPKGQQATFTVTYTPDHVAPIDKATNQAVPDTVQVRVRSTFADGDTDLIGEGIGIFKSCPVAKMIVKEGEEVIPQTMLHLKGDQSSAAAGLQVTKYHWSVKQPAGSNQVFVPGKSFPNPTFTANASGEYKFCLDVWDQDGVKSCAPGCVTVLVLPEEAIHVELLWDTPADPDLTDTGTGAGADLDLHFAHPLSESADLDCDGKADPWFTNPYDAFWFNPNPNWGNANPGVMDDPILDLNDTDGAGPENLNLDIPGSTGFDPTQYAVGVHYMNDHGFGTSFATVNIYIEGSMVAQFHKVEMKNLDMWFVGRLNWPNTLIGGQLPPFQACHKDPGDPCKKGGKWWQPQGGACITKCYAPKALNILMGSDLKSGCK